jgi:hypothetical protein
MTASTPASRQPPEDDTALLIAALNQAWAFYDGEANRTLQVVNYFLVAAAVLATAYVGALNGKHYAIAAVLAAIGLALTLATLIIGQWQRAAANSAFLMVQELYGRVSERLKVQPLGATRSRVEYRLRPAVVTAGLFSLILAIDIGALVYALTR